MYPAGRVGRGADCLASHKPSVSREDRVSHSSPAPGIETRLQVLRQSGWSLKTLTEITIFVAKGQKPMPRWVSRRG